MEICHMNGENTNITLIRTIIRIISRVDADSHFTSVHQISALDSYLVVHDFRILGNVLWLFL